MLSMVGLLLQLPCLLWSRLLTCLEHQEPAARAGTDKLWVL